MDGTCFYKSGGVNASKSMSKEQSQVMGIAQRPNGQDVGGNFHKLLKRWKALYPLNKKLLEINAKSNNASISTNSWGIANRKHLYHISKWSPGGRKRNGDPLAKSYKWSWDKSWRSIKQLTSYGKTSKIRCKGKSCKSLRGFGGKGLRLTPKVATKRGA
jgi:hypothetical protein